MGLWPFIVIWVVSGIFAGMIASSKGRDGGSWFFLGLFFGLFALLAAIGISSDDGAIAQQQVAQGSARVCPWCAETIKAEAIVCRFCGRDVEPIEPEYVPARKTYPVIGACSGCGKRVRSDATDCPWCGIHFAAPPERVQ